MRLVNLKNMKYIKAYDDDDDDDEMIMMIVIIGIELIYLDR